MEGLSKLGQLKARTQAGMENQELDNLKGTSETLRERSDNSNSSSDNNEFDKKLMDAAEKVEGYMISFLVKQMRETVNRTKGLYERGQAEKIFRSRLDNKLAEKMAESKNFGIAESVYNQFSADKI